MKSLFTIFFLTILLTTEFVSAQSELRIFDNLPFLRSVNSQGVAIGGQFMYDFMTDSITQDTTVVNIASINDQGDLAGEVADPTTTDSPIIQGAYKLNGQDEWTRIGFFGDYEPEFPDGTIVTRISPNGKFLTGILTYNIGLTGHMFRYNTETQVMENIHDETLDNSFGFGALDDGTVYGRVGTIEDFGSLFRPAIVNEDGVRIIGEGLTNNAITSQLDDATSDGRYYVGSFDGKPMIYDAENDSVRTFPIPDTTFISGTFTGISDNLLCIGYVNTGSIQSLELEAIVYDINSGADSVRFLRDILQEQGIDLPSEFGDDFMGPAFDISSDGQYIVGAENSSVSVGFGFSWMLRLENFTTSTNDIVFKENAFQLHPNPSFGEVRIELPETMQGEFLLTVTDMTGKNVHQLDYTDNIIDVSFLEAGMYIFSLNDANNGQNLGYSKLMVR